MSSIESNKRHYSFAKQHKWHVHFKDILNRIKIESNLNVIISIFEWQHLTPISFIYEEKIVKKIKYKIEALLKKSFKNLLDVLYTHNQIILISEHKNLINHEKIVKNIVRQSFTYGISLMPEPIFIDIRVGSARFDTTLDKTLNNAYKALYEAKKQKNIHNFEYSTNPKTVDHDYDQLQLAAYFLKAIKNQQLRLAFQPIIESKSGKIESYEALLRISDEDGKIISAGSFIPTAETYGFIDLVDHFVLECVADELKRDSNVKIAMNLSMLTTEDDNWYNKARKLLNPELAKRLIIEITETSNEANLNKVSQFVDKVKLLGCNVAIDDFGAGYTSFKQLKFINADILKIDGIYIRDIIDNHESKLFVHIMLEFAKACNLKTVAEYVETKEIAKVLIDLGVDYLQGFYFNQALNYRPWIQGNHS